MKKNYLNTLSELKDFLKNNPKYEESWVQYWVEDNDEDVSGLKFLEYGSNSIFNNLHIPEFEDLPIISYVAEMCDDENELFGEVEDSELYSNEGGRKDFDDEMLFKWLCVVISDDYRSDYYAYVQEKLAENNCLPYKVEVAIGGDGIEITSDNGRFDLSKLADILKYYNLAVYRGRSIFYENELECETTDYKVKSQEELDAEIDGQLIFDEVGGWDADGEAYQPSYQEYIRTVLKINE